MPEHSSKAKPEWKWVGCGCLLVAALLAVAAGLAVFFALQTISPRKLQAHHFLPRDAAATVHLQLHEEDEGLAAVYSLLIEEYIESGAPNLPAWLNAALSGLQETGLDEGPVGPRVLISLPHAVPPGDTIPLIIVDLNSYSRSAAAVLQISLKTSFASTATPIDHHDITLYDASGLLFDFAMHKGFLLIAGDIETLRSSVDAFRSSRAADWPEGPVPPEGCDLHADWRGDLGALAIAGIKTFDLEGPKDGDIPGVVRDVARAELCMDVVSADQLTFSLQGVTQTVDALHRLSADLQEQARKLQATLKESNLDLQFTTRTHDLTVILEGQLSGLEHVLRDVLQSFAEESPSPREAASGE